MGGGGFWARLWVLNEETFELEREEQKKRAICKSTFFPAIFKQGAKENSSELQTTESLIQGVARCQGVKISHIYKIDFYVGWIALKRSACLFSYYHVGLIRLLHKFSEN